MRTVVVLKQDERPGCYNAYYGEKSVGHVCRHGPSQWHVGYDYGLKLAVVSNIKDAKAVLQRYAEYEYDA